MIVPLTDSDLLDPVSELGSTGTSVVITDSSYATWDAMFAANPSADDYLIMPGNYLSWGTLTVSGMNGTAMRRRTIRYWGSDRALHPLTRADSGGEEAVIKQIKIGTSTLGVQADYWILSGLTIRGENDVDVQRLVTIWPTPVGVVLHECLVENHYRGAIDTFGQGVYVQRCVSRNAQWHPNVDTWGIMTAPAQGVANVGTRVLDCEFYNSIDQAGATVSSSPGDGFTEVRDCIYDGCDFYNTQTVIDAGAMENLLDFKTGSDTPDTNFVRNSRFWGLGDGDSSVAGSGGSTNTIMFHRCARNWTVEDCIVGENVSATGAGLYESVWNLTDVASEDLFQERYIKWRRNIVYDHAGWAFRPDLDGQFTNNQVVGPITSLFRRNGQATRKCPTLPVVTGNRLRSVNSIMDPEDLYPNSQPPYEASQNSGMVDSVIKYQRRRFSGPEWQTITSVFRPAPRNRAQRSRYIKAHPMGW